MYNAAWVLASELPRLDKLSGILKICTPVGGLAAAGESSGDWDPSGSLGGSFVSRIEECPHTRSLLQVTDSFAVLSHFQLSV